VEKGHGRIDRWRIARRPVTPEAIGLCGCWQVIVVERHSQGRKSSKGNATLERGYYVTSLTVEEADEAAILALIRGHWSAVENGTHYRRDVTLGEDANRTAHRNGAAVLATLRNLANGIYELEKARQHTTADTFKSWCRQQTFHQAWKILNR
jgi:predicted transposase YbfD/YdcC